MCCGEGAHGCTCLAKVHVAAAWRGRAKRSGAELQLGKELETGQPSSSRQLQPQRPVIQQAEW